MKKKIALKATAFLALVLAIAVFLSVLFTPLFDSVHGTNKATIRGMYSEPQNSVQVAFVGTSSMFAGISPVQFYEETGISSYNCATVSQPLIASYYLIKELHRLNPESLKTVVIDPVKVLEEEDEGAKTRQVFLLMDMTPIKLEAFWDCAQQYEDFVFLENLIPVLGYHSRWNQLYYNDYDYIVNGVSELDLASHGYYARYGSKSDPELLAKWAKRKPTTSSIDFNQEEFDAAYSIRKPNLDKLLDYCAENNIKVMFAKLPRLDWTDFDHDAIQSIADEYGIDFLDMNTTEAFDETNFDVRLDMVDHAHANVCGSVKLTHYLADYMKNNGLLESVEPAAEGLFSQYDIDCRVREVEDGQLFGCSDLEEYFNLLKKPRYIAFIASQGQEIELNSHIQNVFRDSGLNTLATLETGKYYIGILRNGAGIRGLMSSVSEDTAFRGSFDGNTMTLGVRTMQPRAQLDYKFDLLAGDESIIAILGEDHCIKQDGLNIVVYDTETGELVDSSCFSLKAPYNRIEHEITSIEVI